MRNLPEQIKKAFCYQKLFWPFTIWINCSSDLKNFANSQPSALNFKSFTQSLEQFFLTVGQNNFGNKIPDHTCHDWKKMFSQWTSLHAHYSKVHGKKIYQCPICEQTYTYRSSLYTHKKSVHEGVKKSV